ncbi:hypothetical protein OC846_000502 [Tilletia horrida]|uniref:Vacuolar sorting protein Vps3844 C-terminal domain-containing protein n=1 Tax=Tilletia horrida TaxID=155126 RepID=A0AAN6GVY9_9BASI|nr:hypothetical protein OC845_001096 [Tilletia horrida]KAK0557514.1 hypothetical protein OC846_000502 [Tilletia horrida]KAK0561435.1 hypothetical protein OC861_005815 [Tilletia horrida]
MRCSGVRATRSALVITFLCALACLLAIIPQSVHAQQPPSLAAQQPASNLNSAQTLANYPASFTQSAHAYDDGDDGGVNPLLKDKIPREKDFVGKCFRSEADLEKATKSCSGRGSGRQSRLGGAVCWRCVCKPDRREGRVTYFGGEACQKIDVSGPFVLLASTTIILILIIAASVGLLFKQGQEELPSTLAGVSIVTKDH